MCVCVCLYVYLIAVVSFCDAREMYRVRVCMLLTVEKTARLQPLQPLRSAQEAELEPSARVPKVLQRRFQLNGQLDSLCVITRLSEHLERTLGHLHRLVTQLLHELFHEPSLSPSTRPAQQDCPATLRRKQPRLGAASSKQHLSVQGTRKLRKYVCGAHIRQHHENCTTKV